MMEQRPIVVREESSDNESSDDESSVDKAVGLRRTTRVNAGRHSNQHHLSHSEWNCFDHLRYPVKDDSFERKGNM